MCLTSQNHNWFKSFDTKCTQRLHLILAKSEIDHQNLHRVNGHFTTISGHFCAKYMKIFNKTEIQKVILRCYTSLNHDWCNSYDTKHNQKKTWKNINAFFFYNTAKRGNGNICILTHNFWFNQHLDQLGTSKWPSEPQFCEIW